MLIQNNESFKNLSNKLKGLGLTNYNFINQTENDIWYFLRNTCVVQHDGINCVPLHLNLLNLEALFLLENGADVYLTSPRVSFGTTTICAYILWKALNENFTFSLVSPSRLNNEYMFIRMRNIIKLPIHERKNLMGFVDIDNVIKYEIDVDLIFIDDFENFKNSDVNKIFKLLKLKKEGKIKSQIVFKSCLGRQHSLGRRVGDDIAKTAHKFEYYLFDNPQLIQSNELYYVQEKFENIFDDSDNLLERIKKDLNFDDEILNNDFLCNRCKNYEIR